MGILEGLTMSEITKRYEATLPHLVLRKKMLAQIDEQLRGAQMEQAGQ